MLRSAQFNFAFGQLDMNLTTPSSDPVFIRLISAAELKPI
jgi:hypothetical protein